MLAIPVDRSQPSPLQPGPTGSSAGNRNKQRRDKARRDGPSHDPVMPNYADRKSESNPASDRQAHKPK